VAVALLCPRSAALYCILVYTRCVKTVTVRLPNRLAAEIEAESRGRGVSKSDVVRERLQVAPSRRRTAAALEMIADLIGSVDGLPADLSAHKKRYLRTSRYGRKRGR
jgi:Arc/MetJ-type ribon-helix-helix transcriptional regulator